MVQLSPADKLVLPLWKCTQERAKTPQRLRCKRKTSEKQQHKQQGQQRRRGRRCSRCQSRSSPTVLGRDHAREGIPSAAHRGANVRADFSSRSAASGLGSHWSRVKACGSRSNRNELLQTKHNPLSSWKKKRQINQE